jgi:serine/threonine protein kinase
MKIVNKSLIAHPVLQELMQQELEVLAGVDHPNIMRVYDLIEDQTNFYIITEIITGGELY